jgi:hypothetical protein
MSKAIALLAAVAGVGAAIYSQLPELRRYTKIRQM